MPIQQPSMLLIRKLVGFGWVAQIPPLIQLLINFFKSLQRDISWWEGDRFAVLGSDNCINTVFGNRKIWFEKSEKYTWQYMRNTPWKKKNYQWRGDVWFWRLIGVRACWDNYMSSICWWSSRDQLDKYILWLGHILFEIQIYTVIFNTNIWWYYMEVGLF